MGHFPAHRIVHAGHPGSLGIQHTTEAEVDAILAFLELLTGERPTFVTADTAATAQ